MTSRPRTFSPEFIDEFLSWFWWHKGAECAVMSRVIEARFNIIYRDVQYLMNQVDAMGLWLCSGSTGYFWTDDPDEYLRYNEHLKSRAVIMIGRHRRVRRRARSERAAETQTELWRRVRPTALAGGLCGIDKVRRQRWREGYSPLPPLYATPHGILLTVNAAARAVLFDKMSGSISRQ